VITLTEDSASRARQRRSQLQNEGRVRGAPSRSGQTTTVSPKRPEQVLADDRPDVSRDSSIVRRTARWVVRTTGSADLARDAGSYDREPRSAEARAGAVVMRRDHRDPGRTPNLATACSMQSGGAAREHGSGRTRALPPRAATVVAWSRTRSRRRQVARRSATACRASGLIGVRDQACSTGRDPSAAHRSRSAGRRLFPVGRVARAAGLVVRPRSSISSSDPTRTLRPSTCARPRGRREPEMRWSPEASSVEVPPRAMAPRTAGASLPRQADAAKTIRCVPRTPVEGTTAPRTQPAR